ncbi:MAG TPA: LuxR C-terminal-related transcriptional regulator [Dehalococcoidia bacterium]|nr:LuxR C-terminal-related transcriptional regulator [Dehalococcoidia bacterium]
MDAPPVKYVKTSDGYNIAYCVCGEGMPLVFIPPRFSSVQLVWRFYRDWMEALASRFRLVHYDPRCEGLSTPASTDDLSIEAYLRDLEAVVEINRLERFIIWGFGPQAHIGVRYALANLDKARALILHTCAADNAAWDIPQVSSRYQWEHLVRSIASLNSRGFSRADEERLVEDYKSCLTREQFLAGQAALSQSDLTQELPSLRIPTLILHQREHFMLNPDESMRMTAMIPGADFTLLDTNNLFGDLEQGLAAVDRFTARLLADGDWASPPGVPQSLPASATRLESLSSRQLDVLRLIARGKTTREIAEALVLSERTIERHIADMYAKIGARNRAEATAYALSRVNSP